MRRVALVIVLATAVVTSACSSQGERKQLADALTRSVKLADDQVYAGQLVVALRPRNIEGGPEQQQQVRGGTLGQLAVTLDRSQRRAALSPTPGAPPIVLFDAGTAVYARRVTRSEHDRRKWARLDYERLPDVDDVPSLRELGQATGPGDVAVIDPVFLTDLLRGVLTGSVKLQQTAADGSRLLTFNTSIDKAERKIRIDEADRKERAKLLRSLAITGDVHKGEAILRADGTVSSVRILLTERPDKRTAIDLEATLTLVPLTAEDRVPTLSPPSRDVTVRVPALAVLKGTIQEQLVALGGRL